MRRPSRQAVEGEGYFAPMADMMAGLLFIFLVLLMVFALNNYAEPTPDPNQDNRAEQDRQRLIAEILAARTGLLETIAKDLRERKIEVAVDAAAGQLRMPSPQFFAVGEARTSTDGGRRLADMGEVLLRRTACHVQNGPACADKSPARIENALLAVRVRAGDVGFAPVAPQTLAATRMFQAFGTLVSAQPRVYEVRNDKGAQVFTSHAEAQPPFDGGKVAGEVLLTVSMLLPPPLTPCAGAPGCP